jgi:hypothetical protein
MSKLFAFLLLFLGLYASAQAQNKAEEDELYYWKILSKVKFKTVIDDKNNGDIYSVAVFSKAIENLEGKKIWLKGYIIPADLAKGRMTMSMFPFSSCFFCGKAGPETVVEIVSAQPLLYRMDKPIEIQGNLKLNRTDPLRLMYILENATYRD